MIWEREEEGDRIRVVCVCVWRGERERGGSESIDGGVGFGRRGG